MTELTWHRVAGVEELPEGRVRTVVAGHRSVALTHYDGQYGALDNRCPHQGGPLGEGSIENGLLRCPWHGFDYCPLTGRPPSEFADEVTTYAVEVRDDGVYVGVEPLPAHARTVSDVMVETMVAWGVRHVFGMVGHSNLGLADAHPPPRRGRRARVHRHPPRGRRRLRCLGLRQAHRPPGCVPDDRRARARPTS